MNQLIGLVILVLDIIAVVDCVKSDKPNGQKALWVVLIIVLPVIGLIAYYIVGKKS